jgi:hypothetical protein
MVNLCRERRRNIPLFRRAATEFLIIPLLIFSRTGTAAERKGPGADVKQVGNSRCIRPRLGSVLPDVSQMSDPPSRLVLTIVTQGSLPDATGILDQMSSEVETLLAPVGLRLEWRELDLKRPFDSVCMLACLRFVNQSRNQTRVGLTRGRSSLGFTHVTDGEILPFCEVDSSRVLELIAKTLSDKPRFVREHMLARALGRVVAHELYHAVARTTAHSRTGLAKPTLSPEELTEPDISFDSSAVELLRRAIAGRICIEPYSDLTTSP